MCNMKNETNLLSLTAAEIEAGDVIVGGPHGPEVTVLGAYRPNYTDFSEPVRSLAHAALSQPEVRTEDSITFAFSGGVTDHYYGLDERYAVLRGS